MKNLYVVVLGLVLAACGGSSPSAPSASSSPPSPSSSPATDATEPAPSASSAPDRGANPLPSDAPPPVVTACAGLGAQPLDGSISLTFGGEQRTAQVHVPASYDASKPTPLVLNFHGYFGSPDNQQSTTHMNAKSDAKGFIAVHPAGLDSSWNAGACCGGSAQNGVDDVGFVNALLDALEAKLCVDTHRVFSTGMSNGGFLSHRLGCELSSRIAAIAPVSGVMGIKTCNPTRAMPVIHFHGTADPLVPYGGNPAIDYPPVADTIKGWADRNACTGAPVETFKNGTATCSTYSTCKDGSEVTLCTLEGEGHQWPGGDALPFLGNSTNDLIATDALWDFFVKHPMP